KEKLLVVDTGRHQSHTEKIVELSKKMYSPVVDVVNTHWHLDHIGGNALIRREFPKVRIYASGALGDARKGFLENYRHQLEGVIAQTSDPAQKDAYTTELHLVEASDQLAPDVVVTKSQKMALGGRRVELYLEKNAVTAGDLWVYEPFSHVLVAGDLVTLPVPFLDTACPAGWSSALDRLERVKFKTLIPGHGAPMTRSDFETYRTAYRNLIACSASSAGKDQCIDGWMSDAAPLLKDEKPEFVRSLLDYYVGNVLRGDPAAIRKRCGAA
ncbi:MAG TPA: MBL fold metallo-hydrolase, partial [Thermoanaerobaculia bacterium]|nr:MBL fold metallo-hydrolase [Thermoanaerobaculia bacterium]